MIEIREVKTRKEQKEFLNFPLKLYKGCPYYSPNLYISEKEIFKKDYFYYKTSEAIYFNAYKDGKIVGRIGGILQKSANEKWKQKRIRFTRFDLIEDFEVAKALLKAVEDWAKTKGMDEVFGPMGFSDLEKEGLLVEGFEEPTTFSENYNYEYYKTFLEKLGYVKDVDWIAHQCSLGDLDPVKKQETIRLLLKKYNLHLCEEKNTAKLLKRYGKKFFDIVEESYGDLYQTVPFIPEQIEDTINSFKLILDTRYISLVLDEKDEVVAFGLAFPMISDILNKTGGHLYPWILPKLIHAIKHPHILELGLIGVTKEYLNTGVAWCTMGSFIDALASGEIEYAETNLNLETNAPILAMLGKYKLRTHRRVRTYIKKV